MAWRDAGRDPKTGDDKAGTSQGLSIRAKCLYSDERFASRCVLRLVVKNQSVCFEGLKQLPSR